MNDREAFKFGFIQQCIEVGLTTPQDMLSVVKQAGMGAGPLALLYSGGEALKGLAGAVQEFGSWALPAALVAPPAIGYGLGRLAGRAGNSVSDTDVEGVKNQELIDEYRQQASRLRREGSLRRMSGNGQNGLL